MGRTIDLKKTVLELSQEHPEFLEVMKELGFQDIANPTMLKTVGRFMTIPKGAMVKGISMERVIGAFEEKGFQVLNK